MSLGFLSPESTSEAQDRTLTQGDESQGFSGNRNLYNQGINLGNKASLTTAPQFTVEKGGTLVVNDGAQVSELTKSFTDTLKGLTDTSNATLSNLLNRQTSMALESGERTTGLLSNVLEKIGELSESNATGGASSLNKTMLWAVAGILLLVGYIIYKR